MLFLAGLIFANRQEKNDGADVATSEYFADQIQKIGINNLGAMPIEGFDAGILMQAFEGLKEEDFNNVETFEGKYLLRNGELVFERTQSQPISSAEKTLSEKGYKTLIANLSSRLNLQVADKADVDKIISKINSGPTKAFVQAGIGQAASALGVTITPAKILEDSRCPVDVQCIWAGQVRLEAQVKNQSVEKKVEFKSGSPVAFENFEITLTEVRPEPRSQKKIETADYIFTFELKKIN